MARIISKAREVRLDYQAKRKRIVSMQEVAETLGIDRRTLGRIEASRIERLDTNVLAHLCTFYGVNVGDLLECVSDEDYERYISKDDEESIECLAPAGIWKPAASARHSTCIEPEGSLQPAAQAA
jgi:DNA-binding Xre family transcriptional regulator